MMLKVYGFVIAAIVFTVVLGMLNHLTEQNKSLKQSVASLEVANGEWDKKYSLLEQSSTVSCTQQIEHEQEKASIEQASVKALEALKTLSEREQYVRMASPKESFLAPKTTEKQHVQDAYVPLSGRLSPDVGRLLDEAYCAATKDCAEGSTK